MLSFIIVVITYYYYYYYYHHHHLLLLLLSFVIIIIIFIVIFQAWRGLKWQKRRQDPWTLLREEELHWRGIIIVIIIIIFINISSNLSCDIYYNNQHWHLINLIIIAPLLMHASLTINKFVCFLHHDNRHHCCRSTNSTSNYSYANDFNIGSA